jgi:hypothetical protein
MRHILSLAVGIPFIRRLVSAQHPAKAPSMREFLNRNQGAPCADEA